MSEGTQTTHSWGLKSTCSGPKSSLTCFIFPEIAENDVALILMGRWPDEHHHSEDVEPTSLHQEISPYHIDYRNKNYLTSQLCKISAMIKKSFCQQKELFPYLLLLTRRLSWYNFPSTERSTPSSVDGGDRLSARGSFSGPWQTISHWDTFSSSFFKCFEHKGQFSLLLVWWDYFTFLFLSMVSCLFSVHS